MASPFTEVNFRPPFPLRAAHVFIQFVRYFTRRASILQYNLFDISLANHPSCVNSTTNFAEFKPLNLPKLNKKFTDTKRKSRQKPPPNAHFCTVFGTSIFRQNAPFSSRNPARRPRHTPHTTPRPHTPHHTPQPGSATPENTPATRRGAPHHTPHHTLSRHVSTPRQRRSETPRRARPRPASTPHQTLARGPVPDVPPPSPEAHARRRQTPRTRPSSPRSARCGTPALPGLARRSEPPSGRYRTAPRDERSKVARAITCAIIRAHA